MSQNKSAILIFNYGSTEPDAPAWEWIPEDVWQILVKGFFAKVCDGFGLRWVENAKELSMFGCFADWQPNQIGLLQHYPESIPPDIENPDTYTETVAIFELNQESLNRILSVPFEAWEISNDEYPTDEVIFTRSGKELAMAVPYESQIYFEGLTPDDIEKLIWLDKRIAYNLRDGENIDAKVVP